MRVASVEESPKILLGISEVKKRSLTCYHCREQLPGGGRVPVGWEKLSRGLSTLQHILYPAEFGAQICILHRYWRMLAVYFPVVISTL